jgi:hypothetical protein
MFSQSNKVKVAPPQESLYTFPSIDDSQMLHKNNVMKSNKFIHHHKIKHGTSDANNAYYR